MIKIVKTDNNQTELVDICFVVGYTCTNIDLALCNYSSGGEQNMGEFSKKSIMKNQTRCNEKHKRTFFICGGPLSAVGRIRWTVLQERDGNVQVYRCVKSFIYAV